MFFLRWSAALNLAHSASLVSRFALLMVAMIVPTLNRACSRDRLRHSEAVISAYSPSSITPLLFLVSSSRYNDSPSSPGIRVSGTLTCGGAVISTIWPRLVKSTWFCVAFHFLRPHRYGDSSVNFPGSAGITPSSAKMHSANTRLGCQGGLTELGSVFLMSQSASSVKN